MAGSKGRRRSNAPPLPDWKPVYHLLECHGFDTWLVNARDVKHLPGRPKTDKLDAVWLCKVAERQMLRPSFVPPAEIRIEAARRYIASFEQVTGRPFVPDAREPISRIATALGAA